MKTVPGKLNNAYSNEFSGKGEMSSNQSNNVTMSQRNTVYPRSLEQNFIVSDLIKWINTSLTYSI